MLIILLIKTQYIQFQKGKIIIFMPWVNYDGFGEKRN